MGDVQQATTSYNKRGKHQGVLDPNTGQPIPGKGPDPTRSVEP
ncbi:colicin E3/pyocin S6 family cytotoxin [Amycolatopsis sp. NPDC059027]